MWREEEEMRGEERERQRKSARAKGRGRERYIFEGWMRLKETRGKIGKR